MAENSILAYKSFIILLHAPLYTVVYQNTLVSLRLVGTQLVALVPMQLHGKIRKKLKRTTMKSMQNIMPNIDVYTC